MINIIFTCSWMNNEQIFNSYKQNTPDNLGIWKNIKGVIDINEAEYIIILDDLHVSFLNNGIQNFLQKFNYDKIIHFQRENTTILNKQTNKSWYLTNVLPNIKYHITYEKGFLYTFAPASFINKTYDELKSMTYPEKTKNISCVISSKILNHITDNYYKRVQFIQNYSKNYPNKIDIYGKGWNTNILGDNYKGELDSYHNINYNNSNNDKSNGLIPYHYSIALENLPNEECISEKLTDTILCWCMPLYWGNKCIEKYIPTNAFHLIDIENKNIFNTINTIILKEPTLEEIDNIKTARNVILDKLNIWEQIYSIINDYEFFVINYKSLD